jgi:chloramphenicol 3-O phosphotransferase
VLFDGVRCPRDIVLRREVERKDGRTLGQAEAHFEVVHRWGAYDVEVDTSVLTPDEAAARIKAALDGSAGRRVMGLGANQDALL